MKMDSFRLNCLMVLMQLLAQEVHSFHISPSKSFSIPSKATLRFRKHDASSAPASINPLWRSSNQVTSPRRGEFNHDTSLQMYNLPPGRGGGGGIKQILKGVGGLALTFAFFASPVGGFILGIFNSFLLLALLLPTLATVGFKAWQYFYTMSDECPNCGVPITVVKTSKDGEVHPTPCFQCGDILQASYDNSRIDNVTGRNSINDQGFGQSSVFDIFGGPGVSSGFPSETTTRSSQTSNTIYDINDVQSSGPTSRPSSGSSNKKKVPTKKDMGNIIDAEIEDDLPFQ